MTNSAYSMILHKKNQVSKYIFFQLFWVQTIPVHWINGKSQFLKTGDFEEQQFPCPTGGYTGVNQDLRLLKQGLLGIFQ